jgi:putative oxidoreductase
MLKQFSLTFLRVAMGLLLIIWGFIRVGAPEAGIGVSTKYYGGVGAATGIQYAWGVALLIIGLLVVLGLFRRYSLPAQAVVLCFGALSITKYLLDPLGLWLLSREDSQVLFFPSLAMAAASLLLVAMRDEDRWAIDVQFGRN